MHQVPYSAYGVHIDSRLPNRKMVTLVAFASATGSTQEIAQRIASRIANVGEAECLPIGSLDRVDEFDTIVIGSAIHNGAWMQQASWINT